MGRLRPNLASGKVSKPNDAKKPVTRAEHQHEPVTKRSKLADERATAEVELGEPTLGGLEAMVYPMEVQDFVKRFWEQSQAVHIARPYDSLWNAKLMPSAATKSRLTSTLSSSSNPAFYHTDVQLMGYFMEDDDLFFETPEPGPISMSDCWSAASKPSGPSLHISNMDLFAPDVKRLLTELDATWRGDGAITSLLTFTQRGGNAFGPHMDGQSKFITQISGNQVITIYEHQTGGAQSFLEAAGDEYAFPCYTHGPFPEMVLSSSLVEEHSTRTTQIHLRPGSTLFLPPCVQFSQVPPSGNSNDDSISMIFYLSSQPRWNASIDTLLSLAASGIDSLKPTSSKKTHESISSGGVVNISSTDPRKVRLEASTESRGSEQGIHDMDQQGDDEDSWTLFPHAIANSSNDASVRAEPGSRLKTALVDLFNRAAQLAPNFVDSLLANATLTRNDFLKNITHIQSKFVSEGGIEEMLDRNGGLIKISNFLPPETADRIFKLISRVPEQDWQEAYAAENASANNIDHAFHSARTFASHHAVFALFKRIMPHLLGDFSMGRYTESHFIAPHDDRAYKEVNGDHFSRHIALIYYCSKDWKPEYGGQLLDLQDNKKYVPEFNSIVAFKVPRFHEVKPVLSPTAQRFSIFGWFFKPGISYDLYLGEDAGSAPSDSVDEE